MYLISDQEVRRFICKYPTEIDLKKVDPIWFIDLMSRMGETR